MQQRTFTCGSVPLLAVGPDDRERPVVLVYHGLHSHKEAHLQELHQLARRGFLAVGVDAVGHGQRAHGPLQRFLDMDADFRVQMHKLLMPTLEEIPWLVDCLRQEGYRRFAVLGISFGGLVAYAAPLVEPSLAGVVPILSTPDWGGARFSPHRNWEAYRNVSIYAWNAGRDEAVSPDGSRELFRRLHEARGQGDPLCCYREFPESGHFTRPEDWIAGWRGTLGWLSRLFS